MPEALSSALQANGSFRTGRREKQATQQPGSSRSQGSTRPASKEEDWALVPGRVASDTERPLQLPAPLEALSLGAGQ